MRLAKRRRVGAGDPMAVVTRFLDAANHHDSDTLYASVHPEFESFQPLHPDRNFRGPGQLISNWKAIFEAEPGFRLTVLRASTTGNTVWVELHGAGDNAEAAGIFILGVENSRIRWVRVYSDLVEGVAEPEPAEPTPQAGATAEQPAGAGVGAEAERPSAEDGPVFVPAAAGDIDGPEPDGPGSGPLRLVEGSDEPGPETAPTSGPSPDPGLRLVDPTISEPGDASPAPEPDPGPVETLVGPSRVVPAPQASANESQPTDAQSHESGFNTEASPEARSDESWAADRAHPADEANADPSFDEPDTDADPATSDAAEDEPGPADTAEPRSSDTGSRPGEQVLSRLRKVFRKP